MLSKSSQLHTVALVLQGRGKTDYNYVDSNNWHVMFRRISVCCFKKE